MRKVFKLEIKELENRSFAGYASTFGNKDRHGDVIQAGAFTETLERHKSEKTMPALLLHHDMHRPIGVWEQMREDDNGLLATGRLTSGVRDADEAHALMKDGALNSLSIGFIPVAEEYDSSSRVNLIKQVELIETSIVTIPANPEATILDVKAADGTLNIRELEMALRDAGLSRRDAKALIAEGAKALQDPQEDLVDPVFAEILKIHELLHNP